jgi:hypothetical protein
MPINRRSACIGLLPLGSAWSGEEPIRMGLHGMVLFGGAEGLYASHLPMFHVPHDVQLLLHIRLQDGRLEQRMRRTLAQRPELWTIEPEHFDLTRLHASSSAPLGGFGARLFQGHFERGGQERHAAVRVEVEQVLLFNRLVPLMRQAAQQRFFWFGKGREQFLVKWLDQRPDIDLIGRFVSHAPMQGQRLLTMPAGPLKPPADNVLTPRLRQAGAKPVGAINWLYADTSDLA